MELQFHGANCITINTKQARVTIDDNLAKLGAKTVTRAGDIAILTQEHDAPSQEVRLLIDGPGEYEVADVSIKGMAARAHTDEAGSQTATIYKLVIDDVRIVAVGHIYPELSESELEAIGTTDVLLVPVGGNGYTLDGVGALQVIKKIEPKLIIPTHYADKNLKYPVPQQSLEDGLKALAMEPKETAAKLKLKPADITDMTQLIILEKS